MKVKTRIITIEGKGEMPNRELALRVEEAIRFYFAESDFEITQKVRVQVAQAAKDGRDG